MIKLCLTFCTLTLLCLIVNLATTEEDSCFQTKLRNSTIGLLSSFKKFVNKLKIFFKVPLAKLVFRKDKVKHAFADFVEEIIEADDPVIMDTLQTKLREGSIKKQPIMSATEMIVAHGHRVEVHTVRTADGYFLTLHRIIPQVPSRTLSKIVLLHHGLLGSSDDWLLLGPDRALPYLLTNVSYDVWLANARGNKYSRTHTSRTIHSPEYWNFSWHEVGHYDLAATIDYVRKNTNGSSQIDFIGHSLGATALLVLLSTLPQYNPLIRSAVLLAPLAFMYSARGPIRILAEFAKKYETEIPRSIVDKEFTTSDIFTNQFLKGHCLTKDENVCKNALLFLCNGGKEITNQTLKDLIIEHTPSGGSTKTILHYCQLLTSRQFQKYNFGIHENMRIYGTKTPPSYRLNDVTIPVAIICSAHDWLASISDIMSLMTSLPYATSHQVITDREFDHTDFVWSEEAPNLVYRIVIQVLGEMKPTRPRKEHYSTEWE